MSANTPERLTPYRTPSCLERQPDPHSDQVTICPCNPECSDTSSPATHLCPCVHQDARPLARLDMSSATISRPLRVNVRMRPIDVLPPMLQRTSTQCLAGSKVRAREVALAHIHPGGWSVHAALPAVVGPRSLSIRRVLPEREVGRAVPRAPCRPGLLPPVLSHRRDASPGPRSSRKNPT